MAECINSSINKFNDMLSHRIQVPLIDITKFNDDEYFTRAYGIPWLDLRFPKSEKRGIYFVFGCEPCMLSKKVLYIGKASFSSTIGKRLYAHLVKDKHTGCYTMNDNSGRPFNVEYLYGLDLETSGSEIFSSSLEEFLIRETKNVFYLLNGIGNCE